MRVFLLGAALLLGSLSVPERVAAYCQLTTVDADDGECAMTGIPLEWRRQCMTFSLTDTLSAGSPPLETVRTVADLSFAAWTRVQCEGGALPLRVAQTEALGQCLEPEYNTAGRNANTVIFVEDWRERELPSLALGLTELWHNLRTGEILDADMRINQSRGVPVVCDESCPRGSFDLQNVLTHEAGHFFGLGHSDVPGATMVARAGDGEVEKRSLEEDDRAGVCSIYEHLAAPSCTQAAFQPDNGFAAACDVPAPLQERSVCAVGAPGATRLRSPPILLCAIALWSVRRGRRPSRASRRPD